MVRGCWISKEVSVEGDIVNNDGRSVVSCNEERDLNQTNKRRRRIKKSVIMTLGCCIMTMTMTGSSHHHYYYGFAAVTAFQPGIISIRSSSSSRSDHTHRRNSRSWLEMSSIRKRKGDFAPNHHSVYHPQLQVTSSDASSSSSQQQQQPNRNVYQQFTPEHSLHALDSVEPAAPTTTTRIDLTNKAKHKLDSESIAQWLQEEEEEDDQEEQAQQQQQQPTSHTQPPDDLSVLEHFGQQTADDSTIKKLSLIDTKVSLPTSNSNTHMNTHNGKQQQQQHVIRAEVKETGQDMMSRYVKSMGQHELLSKDAEILLGTQIQILVQYQEQRKQLEQKLHRVPTFQEWAEDVGVTLMELKKQMKRSQRAKAALMEANLRLVITVARQTVKTHRSEINFQDACQEGILGLQRACEKFDPTKGFRFSTYAIWWIKRDVHKSVADQSRGSGPRLPAHARQKINDIKINERLLINTLGRKPTNEEIAAKCNLSVPKLQFYRKAAQDAIVSLDKQLVARQGGKGSAASGSNANNSNGKTMQQTIQDDENPTPAEAASTITMQEDVRELLTTLSPKEQAVIRMRFGLDDGKPRTLSDIAKTFKVTTDRIRKIESRALLKLRQPYRNDSVKCYISDL